MLRGKASCKHLADTFFSSLKTYVYICINICQYFRTPVAILIAWGRSTALDLKTTLSWGERNFILPSPLLCVYIPRFLTRVSHSIRNGCQEFSCDRGNFVPQVGPRALSAGLENEPNVESHVQSAVCRVRHYPAT